MICDVSEQYSAVGEFSAEFVAISSKGTSCCFLDRRGEHVGRELPGDTGKFLSSFTIGIPGLLCMSGPGNPQQHAMHFLISEISCCLGVTSKLVRVWIVDCFGCNYIPRAGEGCFFHAADSELTGSMFSFP